MSNWKKQPWSGVYPATLCPFHDDESIDEAGLSEYISEVASVDGINGVVCNGHTGEIMSLKPVVPEFSFWSFYDVNKIDSLVFLRTINCFVLIKN